MRNNINLLEKMQKHKYQCWYQSFFTANFCIKLKRCSWQLNPTTYWYRKACIRNFTTAIAIYQNILPETNVKQYGIYETAKVNLTSQNLEIWLINFLGLFYEKILGKYLISKRETHKYYIILVFDYNKEGSILSFSPGWILALHKRTKLSRSLKSSYHYFCHESDNQSWK